MGALLVPVNMGMTMSESCMRTCLKVNGAAFSETDKENILLSRHYFPEALAKVGIFVKFSISQPSKDREVGREPKQDTEMRKWLTTPVQK